MLFFRKPKEALVEPARRGDGTWQIEVVGESFYQAALKRIAGAGDGTQVWKLADLVAEPKSKFDPNAIKVMIGSSQIGHLSRPHAAVFAAILRERGLTRMDGIKVDIAYDVQTYWATLHMRRDLAKALKDAVYGHGENLLT